MKTVKLSFDPSKGSTPKCISAKQLDHLTRKIEFRFDKTPPPGASLFLRATRPDSASVELALECRDGKYSVRLTDALLAVAGRIECDVAMSDVSEGVVRVLSTEMFYIDSHASAALPGDRHATPPESIPRLIDASLASAKERGEFDGKSAYESACEGGFGGTEAEFYASVANIPKRLSELEEDGSHRTVSDADIAVWNSLPTESEVETVCGNALAGLKSEALYANALTKTDVGEIIAVDGISPTASNISLSLVPKNLVTYPYTAVSGTQNGVTFTVGTDGYITLNGTASDAFKYFVTGPGVSLFKGEKHYARLFGGASGVSLSVIDTFTGGEVFSGDGEFVPDSAAHAVALSVEAGASFDSVRVAPHIELGGEPAAFVKNNPSGGSVAAYGANLALPITSKTVNGITFSGTAEGGIVISGTASGTADCSVFLELPVGEYTVSANNAMTHSGISVIFFNESGGQPCALPLGITNRSHTFTSAKRITCMMIRVSAGSTASSFVLRPQIVLGGKVLPFSPCICTKTSVALGETVSVPAREGRTTLVAPNGRKLRIGYQPDLNKVIADIMAAISTALQ